ncbi:MAG: hypothetical protein H7833_10380 [Magnetococcus sp. DMHC-1]|nr:hypothetical protein [Magnetococcales bacterium]
MSPKTKMRSILSTAAVAVLLACSQGAVAEDAKGNTQPVTPPKSPQELQQRIEGSVNNYWQSKQNAYDAWHRNIDVRQAARERAADTAETAVELNNQAKIMGWQNNQQAWTNAQQQSQVTYQKELENNLKLQEAMMEYRHQQERIRLEHQKALAQNQVSYRQGNLSNAIMTQQNTLMTNTAGINNTLWAERQAMMNQLAQQRAILQRNTGGPLHDSMTAPAAAAPEAPAQAKPQGK